MSLCVHPQLECDILGLPESDSHNWLRLTLGCEQRSRWGDVCDQDSGDKVLNTYAYYLIQSMQWRELVIYSPTWRLNACTCLCCKYSEAWYGGSTTRAESVCWMCMPYENRHGVEAGYGLHCDGSQACVLFCTGHPCVHACSTGTDGNDSSCNKC